MALLTEHADQDQLGGGRFRQTIAIKRIAYRRDGNLRRIGNALGNTGDPALSIGVDELVQFRVADRLAGQSPVLHFGKGASMVRLTPLGTNNVNAVVAGNVITYPGAWDNADLRLSIGGHILRKEILLRTGHPSTFAFRIASHQGLDINTLSTPDFRILQPSLEGPNRKHIPLVWAVSSSGGRYILTCTLPAGDYAGWVVDPTLTLQPDATDGKDTYINSLGPTNNYGVRTPLAFGEDNGFPAVYRTLIQGNLSSLPAAAIISSSILSLYATDDLSSNARTIRVYRLKRSWLEGTRDNVVDDPPTGATWLRYDLTNNWTTPGGFDAADCEQTDIGSRDFTAAETLNQFKAFPLTPTTKAALDLGNGWLIKADTESDDCYLSTSSDDTTAANRPKLVIDYTLPATGMSRAPVASWCH